MSATFPCSPSFTVRPTHVLHYQTRSFHCEVAGVGSYQRPSSVIRTTTSSIRPFVKKPCCCGRPWTKWENKVGKAREHTLVGGIGTSYREALVVDVREGDTGQM